LITVLGFPGTSGEGTFSRRENSSKVERDKNMTSKSQTIKTTVNKDGKRKTKTREGRRKKSAEKPTQAVMTKETIIIRGKNRETSWRFRREN